MKLMCAMAFVLVGWSAADCDSVAMLTQLSGACGMGTLQSLLSNKPPFSQVQQILAVYNTWCANSACYGMPETCTFATFSTFLTTYAVPFQYVVDADVPSFTRMIVATQCSTWSNCSVAVTAQNAAAVNQSCGASVIYAYSTLPTPSPLPSPTRSPTPSPTPSSPSTTRTPTGATLAPPPPVPTPPPSPPAPPTEAIPTTTTTSTAAALSVQGTVGLQVGDSTAYCNNFNLYKPSIQEALAKVAHISKDYVSVNSCQPGRRLAIPRLLGTSVTTGYSMNIPAGQAIAVTSVNAFVSNSVSGAATLKQAINDAVTSMNLPSSASVTSVTSLFVTISYQDTSSSARGGLFPTAAAVLLMTAALQ